MIFPKWPGSFDEGGRFLMRQKQKILGNSFCWKSLEVLNRKSYGYIPVNGRENASLLLTTTKITRTFIEAKCIVENESFRCLIFLKIKKT